jgi:hypothetical protein
MRSASKDVSEPSKHSNGGMAKSKDKPVEKYGKD